MENLKIKINQAVEAFKSGRLLEAEDLTKELISSNPKVAFLYNLMGIILYEQKEVEKALEFYKKGIAIDPDFAEIYNNLGLLYANNNLGADKAESYYKKSLSINSKNPETYNNLGSLYKSLDKYEEAISCYNKAVNINKKSFYAHHNLGNIYTALGNFEEAKKYFKEAIKINPNYANSHRTLSRIIKYSEDDEHLHIMEKIYNQINDTDVENKTNISFALGKAYEDIEKFDKSFSFYNKANNLYKDKINFSIKYEIEKFKKIQDTFNNKTFKKYAGCGNSDSKAIFILGMPRSGTTLVEQILSNHPDVFGGDECEFIQNLLIKNFGKKIDNIQLYFDGLINFDKKKFNEMGLEYVEKMKNISKNFKRHTDKMPENFLWIGFIKLILPKAKIIHCFRNSKDNCLSIFKNHFPGGKINYSYDLAMIVEYYNLYFDLLKYWKTLLPDFIFNIKYEDIILNPEKEIKKLLKFCELDWNNSCLNFHNNKRIVKTASDVQARNKLYNSSINSWKNYENYLAKYFNKLNS
ncbi:MAG: sulfotransferase family protein [Candidatus Pelagibacterales bacterium]|nr:MAG: sulfotransferase family protein [Pelagibacterales bacterium]